MLVDTKEEGSRLTIIGSRLFLTDTIPRKFWRKSTHFMLRFAIIIGSANSSLRSRQLGEPPTIMKRRSEIYHFPIPFIAAKESHHRPPFPFLNEHFQKAYLIFCQAINYQLLFVLLQQ